MVTGYLALDDTQLLATRNTPWNLNMPRALWSPTGRYLSPHHGLHQDIRARSWLPAGKSWPCGSAGVKERKLTPTGWFYFGREGERCCLPAPMVFPARLE